MWAPSTAYLRGQQVISPNNDVVSANVAHTSSAVFTTDQAKWAVSSTYALVGSGGGMLPFSRPGALAVAGGSARLPLPTAATLTGVTASVGTVANADVLVDLNLNGVSVLTNANDRPRIVAGQHISTESALSVATAPGDYLTVDVDACGGFAPPSFITRTDVSGSYGVETATLTRPTGAAVGDVHVAGVLLTVGGPVPSAGEPTTVITFPRGWTRIGAGPTRAVHTTGDRDMEMHFFWWRDDGSQTSWAFTATQPATLSAIAATVLTFRGILTGTNPILTSATSTPPADNGMWPAAAVTPTQVGQMILRIWGGPEAFLTTVNPTKETLQAGTNSRIAVSTTLSTTVAAEANTLYGATASSNRVVSASIVLEADPNSALPGKDLTIVVRYTT
jgi:hypothetical protein